MGRDSDQLSNDLASLKIDRDEPPRTWVKPVVVVVLLLALAAAAVFVGYPYITSHVLRAEVETTEIALISPAQSQVELTSTGYVVPQVTAKIAAKAVGRVATIPIKEGESVKAGQVVATLDDTDQKSAVASARAHIASARARAAASRAAIAEVDVQLARETKLATAGASSHSTVEDLTAHRRSLAAQAAASEADVRSAEVDSVQYQTALDQMTIRAPIDGVLTEKHADVGEMIGPAAEVSIFDLADFNSLAVELDVPESKLHSITLGSPAEIMLDAFPGKRYRGATMEIGKKVDRSKATIKVKVKFVDSSAGALPDMSARVNFLQKELDEKSMKDPPKLVAPTKAITERGGQKVVFVVDTSNVVRQVNIALGDKTGDGYEARSGPPPGTKVIANPAPDLRDGQSIKEKTE